MEDTLDCEDQEWAQVVKALEYARGGYWMMALGTLKASLQVPDVKLTRAANQLHQVCGAGSYFNEWVAFDEFLQRMESARDVLRNFGL